MNETGEPSSSCRHPEIISAGEIMHFVSIADHALLFSSIISSILQIYVIRSALSHLRRRASDECLHLFLLSMTAGDLILTAICYPMEYVQRTELMGMAARIPNILMHYLTWVGLSASSISLILLNVDKLLYFKYPLRYSSVMNRSKGIAIVLVVWISCFAFVLVAWLTESFKCGDAECFYLDLFEGNAAIYVVFSISVCILPTLTSFCVAMYILRIVTMHKKQLAEEQTLCGNPSHVHQTFASRIRTFYFIFMTTIFTACTLLPLRIINLKRTLAPPNKSEIECWSILSRWLMLYLVQLNAIINPLLTVTVLPQYRARICRKLFGLSDGSEAHTKAVNATQL
ncbi:unnamed protein product, partial [Mesorhabditis belari]|uniref:G-protein coupled receptors family 1 profile domain-containing protein n=1 Tax=Mesorhabditis belari TaxID=2138241 RepID=A0AAF3F578_9BILA